MLYDYCPYKKREEEYQVKRGTFIGIETCKISCMKQVASPGSMHDTGAWGWCTGMTQREGMGREEGGGFRMGNTGIPVADSFRYLAKLIQFCKV